LAVVFRVAFDRAPAFFAPFRLVPDAPFDALFARVVGRCFDEVDDLPRAFLRDDFDAVAMIHSSERCARTLMRKIRAHRRSRSMERSRRAPGFRSSFALDAGKKKRQARRISVSLLFATWESVGRQAVSAECG
jgi:hypothetical protein